VFTLIAEAVIVFNWTFHTKINFIIKYEQFATDETTNGPAIQTTNRTAIKTALFTAYYSTLQPTL
jgi:hypothetical protein